jgi:hypothetical protein
MRIEGHNDKGPLPVLRFASRSARGKIAARFSIIEPVDFPSDRIQKEFIMRMLLIAECPHEPFNTLVRKGTAGEVMGKILAAVKPEAAYFTELSGRRTAVLVVNLENASQIPALAEPFFLNFHADCHFHPVMSSEDLQRSGLAELGKKWG